MRRALAVLLLAGCPNPPPTVTPNGCVKAARTGAGAACAVDQMEEPNDDLILARSPTGGTSCGPTTHAAAIASVDDTDVFRTGSCKLSSTDPNATIDRDGLRLCLFFACTIGTTDVYDCYETQPGDSAGVFGKPQPMRSEAGFFGCCRAGKGRVAARVTCHNLQQKAQGFVWIDSGTQPIPACTPYQVTYQMD